ncbi:unnamed protein product [Amoebophrya sp. A120]|nr:unnamed protein product [Amoebophrya sp. A120]|eukprot:GSA120T00018922001.1
MLFVSPVISPQGGPPASSVVRRTSIAGVPGFAGLATPRAQPPPVENLNNAVRRYISASLSPRRFRAQVAVSTPTRNACTPGVVVATAGASSSSSKNVLRGVGSSPVKAAVSSSVTTIDADAVEPVAIIPEEEEGDIEVEKEPQSQRKSQRLDKPALADSRRTSLSRSSSCAGPRDLLNPRSTTTVKTTTAAPRVLPPTNSSTLLLGNGPAFRGGPAPLPSGCQTLRWPMPPASARNGPTGAASGASSSTSSTAAGKKPAVQSSTQQPSSYNKIPTGGPVASAVTFAPGARSPLAARSPTGNFPAFCLTPRVGAPPSANARPNLLPDHSTTALLSSRNHVQLPPSGRARPPVIPSKPPTGAASVRDVVSAAPLPKKRPSGTSSTSGGPSSSSSSISAPNAASEQDLSRRPSLNEGIPTVGSSIRANSGASSSGQGTAEDADSATRKKADINPANTTSSSTSKPAKRVELHSSAAIDKSRDDRISPANSSHPGSVAEEFEDSFLDCRSPLSAAQKRNGTSGPSSRQTSKNSSEDGEGTISSANENVDPKADESVDGPVVVLSPERTPAENNGQGNPSGIVKGSTTDKKANNNSESKPRRASECEPSPTAPANTTPSTRRTSEQSKIGWAAKLQRNGEVLRDILRGFSSSSDEEKSPESRLYVSPQKEEEQVAGQPQEPPSASQTTERAKDDEAVTLLVADATDDEIVTTQEEESEIETTSKVKHDGNSQKIKAEKSAMETTTNLHNSDKKPVGKMDILSPTPTKPRPVSRFPMPMNDPPSRPMSPILPIRTKLVPFSVRQGVDGKDPSPTKAVNTTAVQADAAEAEKDQEPESQNMLGFLAQAARLWKTQSS